MTVAWACLALAAGCRKANEPPPPPAAPPIAAPAAPAPVAMSSAVADMVRLLSARDGGPPCEEVEALSAAPVDDLIVIVDTVHLPPQAPMRAAACLLERHAEEAAPHIEEWMGDEETRGLAQLTAQSFDTLPTGLAVRFAAAGLNGPHHAVVAEHVRGSIHPEVRALVADP